MTRRPYSLQDALDHISDKAFDAFEKGHFRKAEALRRYGDWLRNGCVGHEPSLLRWKTPSRARARRNKKGLELCTAKTL